MVLQPGLDNMASNGHGEHPAGFSTRAIHVGSEANESTGAVIPPISLSTTYQQTAIGVHKGYEYTRSGNPNRDAFERTLAALEAGGGQAIAFASGSATTATVINSLGPGAHLVSVNDVYGGTFRYMRKVANELQGLETTFVDLEKSDDDEILAAFQENTKLVWIESPTNPTLRLIDIPRVVALAKSHPSKPLVLVDNTFLSPYYSSPLLLGADMVMHSITKYINGHADVLMGALILPSSPTHDALTERIRFLQNAHGAVPGAFDCWLAQRGAKTLALRMRQHGENALAVALFLQGKGKRAGWIKDVIYPGLASHPKHALARDVVLSPHAREWVESGAWIGSSQLAAPSVASSTTSAEADDVPQDAVAETGGIPFGGMVSFRIVGGASEANRFLSHTKIFTLAESLGGIESLAELPAQMTHGSIPEEERSKLGIGEDLVRLSVGVEDIRDILRDLETSLEFAVKGDGV